MSIVALYTFSRVEILVVPGTLAKIRYKQGTLGGKVQYLKVEVEEPRKLQHSWQPANNTSTQAPRASISCS